MYATLVGPLSLQAFQYDYVTNVFGATLLEDSDGILPAGSGTCDVTPTVQWVPPSGFVGPFLYSWTLQQSNVSGSVVASGSTVNVNAATMPTLSPGVYYFTNIATDRGGGTTSLSPLVFQVLDCKFSRPPQVVSISPFDIEPVVPADEDYIRYFPQWMALHGTATAPPSASLTFQFFRPTLAELRQIENQIDVVSSEVSVVSVPVDLPRKAWHLQTRYNARDIITINCIASGSTTAVRRESSIYDFLTTDDPVFLLGDNGHIVFRNLAQRHVTVAPVSGSTGATGSVLAFLATQYQMPAEHEGIVADSNVLFTAAGVQYRIKAGSSGVDPSQAVVQLAAPFAGTLDFTYQSETLAPVVTVAISGNPSIAPSPIDLWNRLDELGLFCGIVRRRDESNVTLKKRLISRFVSGIGVTASQVAEHISQDLTLVDLLPWDGQTTLNLQPSGYFGVKYFDVEGLPQSASITETLIPFGSNYQIYTGSKSNWHSGWVVFVNGRLATMTQYPNMNVSGNTVNFGVNVSGTVTATYGYDNYTFTQTDSNTITIVTPAGSNPLSGQYTAVLSKNVNIHTLADPTYMTESLLNPDGTANGFFYEIAQKLTQGSPSLFGEARWGSSAYWLSTTDTVPLTEHLPSVFDVITGY